MEQNKKPNIFVRVMIVILCIFIAILITYNFFLTKPIGSLNSGLFIMMSFLLILVLAESFDNFSIGKLITMSKEIKSKKDKISKLHNEKNDLFNQLINISTANNQKQSNTNIYGFPNELIKTIGVTRAEISEVEVKEKAENQNSNKFYHKDIENYIFNNYIKSSSEFYADRTYRNIKIQAFQGIDPISEHSPVFDAYVNDLNKDVFYEIKEVNSFNTGLYNSLYNMLNKIYLFQKLNKRKSYLHLIIPIIDVDDSDYKEKIDNLKSYFFPATENGLLYIDTKIITKSELENTKK